MTNLDLQRFIKQGGRALNAAEAQQLAALVLDARRHDTASIDTTLAPPTIYHYCSSDAFRSIIQTKAIWLTDSSFTNDTDENEYPKKIALEVLTTRIGDVDARRVMQHVSMFDTPPRIACFTELADSLGQWRAYADDGRGFAVGVSVQTLGLENYGGALAFDHSGSEVVQRVVVRSERSFGGIMYEAGVQRRVLENACNEYQAALSQAPDESARRSAHTGLLLRVYSLSRLMKQAGFAEEREWRIIDGIEVEVTEAARREMGKPQLQVARDSIRSYALQALVVDGASAIVAITCGPRNRSTTADVERFLAENGLPGVRVQSSSIRYRGSS